jgi:hypothetical protein
MVWYAICICSDVIIREDHSAMVDDWLSSVIINIQEHSGSCANRRVLPTCTGPHHCDDKRRFAVAVA